MEKIKFLNRFDRSSKLLIVLSLLGILASVIALRWTFFTESMDSNPGEVIASVTLSRADTRVKRSGNMHWYQVADQINCYQDDMVFTGEDSTATLEFPSGDKIYLLPHSLVSISTQLITLESGAIEVEISGKEQFSIETLGKVVELKEPARFKVIQTEKERKLITISGTAPAAEKFGITQLKDPPKIAEIFELIRPRAGEILPSLPGSKVILEWRYTGEDQNFILELDGKTSKVSGNRFELKRENLAPGKVFWKVTNASNESQNSYFEISEKFAITLNYPKHEQEISLAGVSEKEIDFSWTNPVALPQKFELAKDLSFAQPLVGQLTSRNSLKAPLPAGQYFWRIGYPDNGQVAYWSAVGTFKLSTEAAPTLAITQVPSIWDFSVNPILILDVDASAEIDRLTFRLSGPTKLQGKIKSGTLSLKDLKDGQYKIQIFGSFGKKNIESVAYEFQVKNSKPLAPPKIKNSKVKLYVQVINSIMDAIFPPAHAETEAKHSMSWDGKQGSTFELEVWNGEKSKVIFKEVTQKQSYDFTIPGPGKYFWRVRENHSEAWGPYSDFAEIEAQDKILILKKPLMRKAFVDGKNITFIWHEPYPEFDYFLEIYREKLKTPILSIKVSGGSKTFDPPLSNDKHYWRIRAKSAWGNQNPNNKKVLLRLGEEVSQAASNTRNLYIFRAAYFMTSSQYSQDPEDAPIEDADKTLGMSGSSYQMRGEVWPARLGQRYGLHMGYRKHALSSDKNKLSETEIVGELGYAIKRNSNWSHFLFGGINYSSAEIDLDETIVNYSKSFGTIRYQFNQVINQKFSFTIDGTLLQSFQFDLSAPSIRLGPMLNWHFRPRWSLSLAANYEKNQSNPEYNQQGLKGELKIANTISSYGLMLNWISL